MVQRATMPLTTPGAAALPSWVSSCSQEAREPSATTSTRPSSRFVAWPARPSSNARERVHQRKPTPCTRPLTQQVSRTGLVVDSVDDSLTPRDPSAQPSHWTHGTRVGDARLSRPLRLDAHRAHRCTDDTDETQCTQGTQGTPAAVRVRRLRQRVGSRAGLDPCRRLRRCQSARLGRASPPLAGWQRGHRNDDRFIQGSRAMAVPHRPQGSPACP